MSLPLLFFFYLLLLTMRAASAPSPGYYPSYKFSRMSFNQAFQTLWGAQHQSLSQNQLTIWLDQSSGGSGFKSSRSYRSGYFGASIKLQPGYTAGVITSFYLSNDEAHPGDHDEVDIEFLGTTFDKPYILQTNVYARGSGDGRIIGREMKFHLWFDPTANFHNYAIFWSQNEIIFFVDDVPIRRYPRKSDATFPLRPMWVYGSIWDASSWATENGRYKADYKYQPFVARYTNFVANGCVDYSPANCWPGAVSPTGNGLSNQQMQAMRWAQASYMVYNYCSDSSRDRSQTPECFS